MALELDRDDERAIVYEVIRHPLSYDTHGDGSTRLTMERLAQLAGLPLDATRTAVAALIAAGTIEHGPGYLKVVPS